MSIQAVGAVIDLRGIPPTTKLVLALLANAHNGHTGQCNPDQSRLADEAGISKRSIQDHLGWLESNGYITRKVTELGRGGGKRTDFELTFLLRKNLPEQTNAPEAERQCSGSLAQLLRKQGSGAYKDKPEENRKEPEDAGARDDHDQTLKAIWDAGPPQSRERSSRKRLAEAVQKTLKARRDLTADRLLGAWLAFLRTPDARKDQGRFCPGIHVWLNDNRFDAFLQPVEADVSPADQRALNLERCFYQYGGGGAWRGREFGEPLKPDEVPPGHYPAELYAKYGLKPLATPAPDRSSEAA